MYNRRRILARERAARSRLAQVLHEYAPLLRGSVVVMARACGKPSCRCARGEKHCSLYLSIKEGKSRKMIYVPPLEEVTVKDAVLVSQEVDRLLDEISACCLTRFQAEKAKARESKGRGPRRGGPTK